MCVSIQILQKWLYSLLHLFSASFEILQENVAHTAFHNSAARFDPPKCHPHTRVAVLKKIMDWVHRTDWETWYRYILWLTGAAGAGKSAIAQSIIELCLLEGFVIASFFFFRSDSTRNHAKSLVATLAYQIFFSVPSTQAIIQAAIENDPLIFTRSLEHQFDLLVVQPLRKFYKPLDTLEEKWRRIIVIDGLDECLDHASQRQILNMFRDAIRKYELPIIFLVASRPEHDINTTFGSKHMVGVFARLYLDESYEPDEDIRRFLQDSFEEIRTTDPFKSGIPMVWPTPEAMESIVRKSSGQFVYAATVVRYVHSIRQQPGSEKRPWHCTHMHASHFTDLHAFARTCTDSARTATHPARIATHLARISTHLTRTLHALTRMLHALLWTAYRLETDNSLGQIDGNNLKKL